MYFLSVFRYEKCLPLKEGYEIASFAYTVSTNFMEITQSGASSCGNITDEDERKKCEEKWRLYRWTGLGFTLKSNAELTENILRSVVRLKKLNSNDILSLIQAIGLKKDNSFVTEDELKGTILKIENLINQPNNEELKKKYIEYERLFEAED